MKEQLKIELNKLAHAILAGNSDTETLKNQAREVYEKFCVLAYAEENKISATDEIKNVEKEIESITQTKEIENFSPSDSSEIKLERKLSKPIVTLDSEKTLNTSSTPEIKTSDVLYELEDLTTDFNLPEFEPADKNPPAPSTVNSSLQNKVSLNDSLKKGIHFGLNDRLAFVKHLFDGNQDDFTRVLSQLNTLESESGARNFIDQMVKPEYNYWEGKEEYENRFLEIVFRNFA